MGDVYDFQSGRKMPEPERSREPAQARDDVFIDEETLGKLLAFETKAPEAGLEVIRMKFGSWSVTDIPLQGIEVAAVEKCVARDTVEEIASETNMKTATKIMEILRPVTLDVTLDSPIEDDEDFEEETAYQIDPKTGQVLTVDRTLLVKNRNVRTEELTANSPRFKELKEEYFADREWFDDVDAVNIQKIANFFEEN